MNVIVYEPPQIAIAANGIWIKKLTLDMKNDNHNDNSEVKGTESSYFHQNKWWCSSGRGVV